MDDTASGGHELEIAGMDRAGVSGEIFMVDGALEEVGDCLLPTGFC